MPLILIHCLKVNVLDTQLWVYFEMRIAFLLLQQINDQGWKNICENLGAVMNLGLQLLSFQTVGTNIFIHE
jgi:hypothetical protein